MGSKRPQKRFLTEHGCQVGQGTFTMGPKRLCPRLLDRPILYACGGVAGAGHVRESNLAPTVMTAANQSIGVSQKYHHGLILPDRLIVTRV
ncbi:hypothetical protein DTO166G4_6193 [Paecilomyces variotii]|nr:hypothetical protein DTO164E3_4902 [Paecilomyces variotii]KAJ9201139.1 hypothetical protein DTO032I3_4200 [Paecilomyces variotii]KAJ9212249.1 hypothetical protein DTO166G4_6193 [Paecilomyces variotii]KAJ9229485.1 hypothetical protein DTO166G5_7838 [Paecilomyces variotii]KAJ9247522.1 hypothetical protein DTO207G8_7988 [Paecilomyces variotii]